MNLLKKCKLCSLSIIFFLLIVGCKDSSHSSTQRFCSIHSFKCIYEKTKVEFITNKGSIYLELDGEAAPVTSGNFVDLINKNFYKDSLFNTVIKKPKPFFVKAGNPSMKISSSKENYIDKGNYVDPETGYSRFIPLEIGLVNERYPIYNKLIKNELFSQIRLKHKKGSIAMARDQAVNSASSQFYISLRDLPELDGRYAVFGRVIDGMAVLESIEEGDHIMKINILKNNEQKISEK